MGAWRGGGGGADRKVRGTAYLRISRLSGRCGSIMKPPGVFKL
jgi:hypothetical protein